MYYICGNKGFDKLTCVYVVHDDLIMTFENKCDIRMNSDGLCKPLYSDESVDFYALDIEFLISDEGEAYRWVGCKELYNLLISKRVFFCQEVGNVLNPLIVCILTHFNCDELNILELYALTERELRLEYAGYSYFHFHGLKTTLSLKLRQDISSSYFKALWAKSCMFMLSEV